MRVNHLITQDVLSQRVFKTQVTSVKWLPSVVSEDLTISFSGEDSRCSSSVQFDEKSDGILAGFSDGVVRYLKLRSGAKPSVTEKKLEFDLRMIQVLKPHTKPVTRLAVEVKNQWIATGVSEGVASPVGLRSSSRVPMERCSSSTSHRKV